MKSIPGLEGSRWFIWTIVFLITSGISLATYIYYSSIKEGIEAANSFTIQHPKKRTLIPSQTPTSTSTIKTLK